MVISRKLSPMSRSGYTDDGDQWGLIKWRGQVASAIRGKRGQLFLRELTDALDAMPMKRLIAHELIADELIAPAFIPPEIVKSSVCAIGSVGVRRGVDLTTFDPEDYHALAAAFGIAHQLVQEIEWMNDEAGWNDSPEQRWQRMHAWATENLKEP
jgi:hypothetical protein